MRRKKDAERSGRVADDSKILLSGDDKKRLDELLPFTHKIKKKSIEIYFKDKEEFEKLLAFLQTKETDNS